MWPVRIVRLIAKQIFVGKVQNRTGAISRKSIGPARVTRHPARYKRPNDAQVVYCARLKIQPWGLVPSRPGATMILYVSQHVAMSRNSHGVRDGG
jgi:hypothetical protein